MKYNSIFSLKFYQYIFFLFRRRENQHTFIFQTIFNDPNQSLKAYLDCHSQFHFLFNTDFNYLLFQHSLVKGHEELSLHLLHILKENHLNFNFVHKLESLIRPTINNILTGNLYNINSIVWITLFCFHYQRNLLNIDKKQQFPSSEIAYQFLSLPYIKNIFSNKVNRVLLIEHSNTHIVPFIQSIFMEWDLKIKKHTKKTIIKI